MRDLLVIFGLGVALAGVVIWYLPWARWSMRATLWLVPLALLCVALSNMAGGRDPWEWDLYFLVVFVWIGICQRPGVSLGMLPLFAVAYLAPLYPTHQTSAMAFSSVIYVGIVCAVVGESVAWVSLRWRAAESELGTLMGNLPGMAYNCASDRQWTMRFVSAGCEALTGYQPEELVDNAVVAYGDLVCPEDARQLWDEIQSAIAGDAPWTCTYRIVTAAGELRWVWERGVAVKDASGEVRMLEGFIQDVTDRHEAEEKLTAAAAEWRQTFDAMPDSVAVLDAGGVVQRCNKAATELAGREFDGVVGRHCYEVFHGAHRFIADCPQRRTQVSGQTESSIMWRSERWWRVTFEPAFDVAGELAGGIEVVSDITELKQAEQGLIDSLSRVQALSEETIAAIAGIVEIRDPYTAGHQQRVSELGAAIAEQLGLDADTVVGVRVAGLVHDVGKISVPTEILNKPGRLSDVEFSSSRGTPRPATRYWAPSSFPGRWPRSHASTMSASTARAILKACARAISCSGSHPRRGRLVGAMASHRPYRAALGLETALAEIEDGSGSAMTRRSLPPVRPFSKPASLRSTSKSSPALVADLSGSGSTFEISSSRGDGRRSEDDRSARFSATGPLLASALSSVVRVLLGAARVG